MKFRVMKSGKGETISVIVLLLLAILIGVNYYCFQSDIPKETVIGIVNPNSGMKSTTTGFITGMEENGYSENKNITYIKHESAEGVEQALQDMIDRDVEMIYTVTTPATKKAKDATTGTDIPVVFTLHDPVRSALIKSLVNPAVNLTGVQLRGSLAKAVEWLLTVKPSIRKLYVPVKYDTKAAKQSLADLENIAQRMGIELVVGEVESKEDLERALADLPENIDAIFILHSILIFSHVDKIVEASVAKGIPIGSSSTLYESGVTVTFGSNSFHGGKQASRLATRVLQGNPASNTPAEVAEFFLGVNLKTAKQAGVEIPKEVLLHADFIVR